MKRCLIIIRGAKGVGKTTLLLQRIKEAYKNKEEAFYASLDNVWFGTHTIVELADYMYTHGVQALFLDEIHKYPNWKQEIKNIYDSYPDLKLVITGSSMLELTSSAIGDLSRRARLYTMQGLSFREFLIYDAGLHFEKTSLEDLVNSHSDLASKITSNLKIIPKFEEYLTHGYYPFYKEEGDGFQDRLTRIIDTVVEAEIPSIGGLNYAAVYRVRQLLSIMSERTPYSVNITNLSKLLNTSRETVVKIISLMGKGALTINLYSSEEFKSLAKPQKILFDNTNIMKALSDNSDKGSERETFFASQLKERHKLIIPESGDFLVDNRWLFEVGGHKKGYKQIKDAENSFVVSDDIEIGYGNKIPLWLFGFLY